MLSGKVSPSNGFRIIRRALCRCNDGPLRGTWRLSSALSAWREGFRRAAARWDQALEAGPWLSRVTINLAIDRWRRNRRRGETFTPMADGDHVRRLVVEASDEGERIELWIE
jgi:predicted RNA polymerase sigma factor